MKCYKLRERAWKGFRTAENAKLMIKKSSLIKQISQEIKTLKSPRDLIVVVFMHIFCSEDLFSFHDLSTF